MNNGANTNTFRTQIDTQIELNTVLKYRICINNYYDKKLSI